MTSFLSKIIEAIHSAEQDVPLYEVAIVLPNRRARRLLQQGLFVAGGRKPMFAPQIFPMEEFVDWLSPLKVVDPVTQLLRLHDLSQQYPGDRFATQQLLSWGTAFLKDISDMDMQMQDVPTCLREFAEAAKFEIPFGKDDPSESDIERMQFNELLADVYVKYRELLQANKEAYEGMIYRDCAEHMAEYTRNLPFKRLIFAGFYALSPSELEMIRYLKEHFQTELFFDIDPFYCHIEQEAHLPYRERATSFFITRNCEKLGLDSQKLLYNEPDFATVPKKVKVVATAKSMRQIYAAIQEVERIKALKQKNRHGGVQDEKEIVDMSDTAVVLADENLLLPFLLSYHPEDATINATMGFPFEATPICNLLMQVLSVYESVFALTPDNSLELVFSGEEVEKLWDHELLRSQKPSLFYYPTVIHFSQLPHKELFENISKTAISRRLPSLLHSFSAYAKSVTYEKKYQELWDEVMVKLSELQELFDAHFDDKDLSVDFLFAKYAVVKALHNVSISIKGDPDKGLQVMGLLETRMMDFRNVIMLSVNEGVLPKGLTYNSLLPFDFKYKFDGQDALPNYLYQDQVYAYHFFRLLQRAENVMLIYNNASDVNMAEKSRLIAQLEYEVVSQHLEKVVDIQHLNLDFNLSLPLQKTLSMPKTKEVMGLLKGFEFSASSLQTFITCPLKFYFHYLMRIRETPALSDHLEAYELGTVIHALYKMALDDIIKEPDPAKYDAILQWHIDNADNHICKEICKLGGRKTLTDHDLNQGYWLINRRIIQETVTKYLEKAKQELTTSSWEILANEMEVDIPDYTVVPPDGENPFIIHLTGSLDRVQHIGSDVMILDYKTGKVEESHLHVKLKAKDLKESKDQDKGRLMAEKIEPIFTDSKYDKLFQLVLYTLMYEHVADKKPTSVQVGIVSSREVNRNHPKYILEGKIFDDVNILKYKDALSRALNQLFCKIFDQSSPFTQTDTKDSCKRCPYQHLCGRQTSTESRM